MIFWYNCTYVDLREKSTGTIVAANKQDLISSSLARILFEHDALLWARDKEDLSCPDLGLSVLVMSAVALIFVDAAGRVPCGIFRGNENPAARRHAFHGAAPSPKFSFGHTSSEVAAVRWGILFANSRSRPLPDDV